MISLDEYIHASLKQDAGQLDLNKFNWKFNVNHFLELSSGVAGETFVSVNSSLRINFTVSVSDVSSPDS